MAIKLNTENLHRLQSNVTVPRYEQADLSAGIVHIGVGNFHRAHQAIYLHQLFNRGIDRDWGIVGAGIMPGDESMRKRLKEQDWLSTVIELDPSGYTAQVCGAMIDFAEVSGNSLVQAMSNPDIRIVSLTVTEGGYFIDPKTGGFDAARKEILADAKNPQAPKTVFGAIVAALKNRKSNGYDPFTVMSCDNVPENGRVARAAIIGLAELIAPELVEWIDEHVAFPNSMVDCITPATSDRERAMAADLFAIEDDAVVVCEPYRHWVMEDNFSCGRPKLEEVGVEFVSDVAPYELMKLRILNGGHAAIAYPAALLGVEYAHDAMETDLIRAFLEKLEREEIIPTVPPVPEIDFKHYLEKTMERFSNAEIGDTIPRLCLDGSNRQPKFILPTIADRLRDKLPIKGLALEVAMWCRYCAGSDDAGNPIPVEDENADRLQANALSTRDNPADFLGMSDIFGSLSESKVFAAEFTAAIKSLWQNGTAVTLENYIHGGTAS